MRKRVAILGLTVAVVASIAAVAVADDDSDDPGELNDKQAQMATALADYFAPRLVGDGEVLDDSAAAEVAGALNEQIVEYRTGDTVIGWGAMYKLLVLAEYNGQDLSELVDDVRADGGGWKFGQILKEMRADADWSSSADTPRNFGQFKKEQREKGS